MIEVERESPNESDYWVDYNGQCVGYLNDTSQGPSLCFTNMTNIQEQIKILTELQDYLKQNPIPFFD